MKNLKSDSRKYLRFLIMVLINLFCCLEQVLILMNIWMNGKSLMKQHCQEKIISIVT